MVKLVVEVWVCRARLEEVICGVCVERWMSCCVCVERWMSKVAMPCLYT